MRRILSLFVAGTAMAGACLLGGAPVSAATVTPSAVTEATWRYQGTHIITLCHLIGRNGEQSGAWQDYRCQVRSFIALDPPADLYVLR
ncbi:hypothetical protein PWG71_11600 [Nocardiopsis sp. N85]|uniref:hypothetical protein n=1 Tax=Nocardiopsis sp. N85 TaxID=3029400 RepID=UPI00237EF4A1|nr:hypothetical protein [Nocardiopsis sp. N85]MDE3722036.1 hypothetical protein [Nocardiopsis sp. N85]